MSRGKIVGALRRSRNSDQALKIVPWIIFKGTHDIKMVIGEKTEGTP